MRTPQRSSLLILVALWTALASLHTEERACSQDSGPGTAAYSATDSSSILTTNHTIGPAGPLADAIACMKQLPDGAVVCVSKRPVSRVGAGHIYVEEVDRSAGIKVLDYVPPDQSSEYFQLGNLISFSGVMETHSGERVIRCIQVIDCDYSCLTAVESIAMATPAILGWPLNPRLPQGARKIGLSPVGLYVKICGRVTGIGSDAEDGFYAYIDDGWNKRDRSDADVPGVRLYCNLGPLVGDFLAATGVLGLQTTDPTPTGPAGDEVIIPVLRANINQDPYIPGGQPIEQMASGQVTGTVSLAGQAPPGKTVRVYGQYDSEILENVTSEGKPFRLTGIPPMNLDANPKLRGGLVSATAAGFVSYTRVAASGDSNVDFVLVPSSQSVEIVSDKASIAICSSADSAGITAMARDCEGKALSGQSLRISSTKGALVGAPPDPADPGNPRKTLLVADENGLVHTRLTAGPDPAGTAVVTASLVSDPSCTKQVSISLRGPSIAVTAEPKYLTAAGNSALAAKVLDSEAPIPYANVTFVTDVGTFQESAGSSYATLTDGAGIARATLQMSSQGTATVRAIYTNACSQRTVSWAVVAYKSAPWYNAGMQYSNPLVVDLNQAADGKKEAVVVTASGDLTVLTPGPNQSSPASVLWAKVMHLPGNNSPSCTTLDMDRSGKPCVFIPAESQQKVYAYASGGSPLAGWPAGADYRFIRCAAAIGDVNLDGTPEIVAGDESCYVFSWNPTGDWKKTGTWDSSFLWRNLTGTTSTTIFNTTCALGDIGSEASSTFMGGPDGIPDVIVGSNHTNAVFGFPGDIWGDVIAAPKYLDGYPRPAGGGRVETSPAMGDIDGDSKNDLALGSDDGSVYLWLSSDKSWRGYPTGGPVKSSPALYDLDDDGKLDVIIGSDSGRLFAFNWMGNAPDGWATGIKLNPTGAFTIESSPVIGDVTGDGVPEVVVGCSDGNVYAVYKNANEHCDATGALTGAVAWTRCCVPPGEPTAQMLTTPVLDDVDNDGKVEVLAGGDKGVYLFQFEAGFDTPNSSHFPWPTFHRDNARTGCTTPWPAATRGSIQGLITQVVGTQTLPVTSARIYIKHSDNTPVEDPNGVDRSYVQTVGSADTAEVGRGAFCISQLDPGLYKIIVDAGALGSKTVYDIQIPAPGETGTRMHRIDVQFP